MQQLKLLSQSTPSISVKHLDVDQIKATFTKVTDKAHEVMLEINSHKFLINIRAGLKKLEQFEVVAVKGFVELGMKVVAFLKRLVTVLYFEY